MRSFIALLKVIGLLLATLTFYSAYLIGYAILWLTKRPTNKWLNQILKYWGSTVASILSIKVNVLGKKPDPPFFLVSNHLSYVDIIVLFSQLDTTFVAKSEVKDWPLFGLIARTIGIVFIDRRNKMDIARVNEEISTKVSKHRGLTLFPEGTTSPGEKILRFRPSLLEFPAKSILGVHYCALHYEIESENASAHDTVCWWGDAPLSTHFFNLAKEKNIYATITFGDSALNDEDRKILADKLHKGVSNLFTPMCKSGETEFEPVRF